MRPMLTLASASLFGYTGARHHKLAAAVEFIHTATLLHDDVVDGSGLRRGGAPPTSSGAIRRASGRRLPVQPRLRADGRGRQPQGAEDPSAASAVIAEGEVDQLTAQRRIETSEDHYLEIIAAKTAALFAAACRIAPVVARGRRGGRGGAGRLWPQSRHCLPAGRRCHRLFVRQRDHGQGRRRRLPRRGSDPRPNSATQRGSDEDRAFWRADRRRPVSPRTSSALSPAPQQ